MPRSPRRRAAKPTTMVVFSMALGVWLLAVATCLLLLWAAVLVTHLSSLVALLATWAAAAWAWWSLRRQRRDIQLASQQLAESLIFEAAEISPVEAAKLRRALAGLAQGLAQVPLFMAVGSNQATWQEFLASTGMFTLAVVAVDSLAATLWLGPSCVVILPAADRPVAAKLLEFLRRHRVMAPVDGMLLMCSCADLQALSAGEVARQARQDRQQVDLLHSTLYVRTPLYVLVGCCDRVAGFTQAFATPDPRASTTVLGQRFSGVQPGPFEQLVAEWDMLLSWVARNSLALMYKAQRPEMRTVIFGLPDRLGALRHAWLSWVSAFWTARPGRAAPELAGLFFCAADKLNHDVFRDGILPQQRTVPIPGQAGLAGHRAAAWVLGWAALLLILLPVGVFAGVQLTLASSRGAVESLLSPHGGSVWQTLNDLQSQEQQLSAAAQSATLVNRFSRMDASPLLAASLRKVYLTSLRNRVLQPLLTHDAQTILTTWRVDDTTGWTAPTPAQAQDLREMLRLQLILGGATPAVADWEQVTMGVPELVAQRLTSQAPAGSLNVCPAACLIRHVQFYLAAARRQPALWLGRDEQAIERVRLVLQAPKSMPPR